VRSAPRQVNKKHTSLIWGWQQRQDNFPADPATPLEPSDRATVNELILIYLKHVAVHYKPHRREHEEAGCVDAALTVVQECGYGCEFADSFRPRELKKVREAMIAKKSSRKYINHQVTRIKRMFRFAVQEFEPFPSSVFHALQAMKELRKGTPGVRETEKIQPVPVAHIKAVLEKAHLVLKAMLRFAYHDRPLLPA
jgi:hypothetical protein